MVKKQGQGKEDWDMTGNENDMYSQLHLEQKLEGRENKFPSLCKLGWAKPEVYK